MDLATILYAVIAALFYAGSFYLKNRQAGEAFDPVKFLATVIVGTIVGFISVATGSPLTEEDLITQLVAYMGIISLVENWLKMLFRGLQGQEVAVKAARKAR